MRKIVFLLFIIIGSSALILKKSEVLIPNEAIRIRVIANSNDIKDQEIKVKVKNDVSTYIFDKLKNVDNYNEAKKIIGSSINEIKNIISKYTPDYNVDYGLNYFPEKEYKKVKYKEGKYESLVIKLGNGEGENFWCVLFPPICMIDEEKLNNTTYDLFIKKLLNKVK